MREFGSTAAVAFALANLYLLFLTGPLVSPQHQLIFHLPGSAAALFLPVILDLLLVFLGILGSMQLARSHPRLELLLWAGLLLPLPLVLLETVAAFAGQPANPLALWSAIVFAVAAFTVVAVRARSLVPAFERVRPGLTTILGFVSLSGLILLGQLLWFAWKARDLNPPFVPHAAAASVSQPGKSRVLWIILDELSYRQLYADRLPGLALPNFDRLASASTVFTHVSAAAQYTRIAVPSLLTGRALSATSPTADGNHLLIHPRGQHQWLTLQPEDTVFGDVARTGLPTAVTGWYEPYCRLLPSVLDQCFWTYSDNIPGGLSDKSSVAENALLPLRTAALATLHLAGIGPGLPSDGAIDVRRHAADYRALLAAGDRMLQSQAAGLLLLHMPIPHPWGFYDRETGTFPDHRTSYLDNLALADAYLGHVQSLLKQSGAWNNSTIIIMGDHGWRTRLVWRDSGFWTDEERRASHGGAQDDRPAMIVKLPNQQQPSRIDANFDAVRTRALIDAVTRGDLHTPEQLKTWVETGSGQQSTSTRH